LIKEVKQWPGCRWSQTMKCWYVPDTQTYRQQFGLEEKLAGKTILAKIPPQQQAIFEYYTDELKLRGYSSSTQKTYLVEFAQLLYALDGRDAAEVTYDELRGYFKNCIDNEK
jgi:integrase/recombinase XerD